MRKHATVARNAAYLFLAALIAAIAAPAAAQEADGYLRTLAGKYRQREAALDGADMRWSAQAMLGKSPEPVATVSGRWVRSGDRFRSEFEGSMLMGGEQKVGMLMTSDGTREYGLNEEYGRVRGTIRESTPSRDTEDFSPERLGVVRLWGMPGRMSEMLEDPAGYSARYLDGGSLSVALKEDEVVGDRTCRVVEFSMAPGNGGAGIRNRLYLAGDLNDACVRMEIAMSRDGREAEAAVVDFTAFEEVRPGVYLPAACSARAYDPDGSVHGSVEIKLEGVEFAGAYPDDLFAIQFPPGAHVRDRIANVEYEVASAKALSEDPGLLEVESTLPEPAMLPVVDAAPPVVPQETAVEPAPQASPGRTWLKTAIPIVVIVVGIALIVLIGRKTMGSR